MTVSDIADPLGMLCATDAASMIDRIARLEADMRAMGSVELEVRHYFSKGVYARELHIPKGTTLTGHIHKYENFNIMSKGDMSVLTENGIERVQAPFSIVSPPGTKRVAYAHEDTIWTTIHGTDETDIEKIKQEFVVETHEGYLAHCEALKLEGK